MTSFSNFKVSKETLFFCSAQQDFPLHPPSPSPYLVQADFNSKTNKACSLSTLRAVLCLFSPLFSPLATGQFSVSLSQLSYGEVRVWFLARRHCGLQSERNYTHQPASTLPVARECRQHRDAIHDTFSPSAKTVLQHFCSNNLAGPVGISLVLLISQSSPGLD